MSAVPWESDEFCLTEGFATEIYLFKTTIGMQQMYGVIYSPAFCNHLLATLEIGEE